MLNTIEELILKETQSLITNHFSNFKNQKDEFFLKKILEPEYFYTLNQKNNNSHISIEEAIKKNPKRFIGSIKTSKYTLCYNLLKEIASLKPNIHTIQNETINKLIPFILQNALLEKELEYLTLTRKLSQVMLISNSEQSFKKLTLTIEQIKTNCTQYNELIELANIPLKHIRPKEEQSSKHPMITKYQEISIKRLPKASKILYERFCSLYEPLIKEIENLSCDSDAPIQINRFLELIRNPHLNFERYTKAILMFEVPEFSIKATHYKKQILSRATQKILKLIYQVKAKYKPLELQLTDILKKLYLESPKKNFFPKPFMDQIQKTQNEENYDSLKSIISTYFEEKTKSLQAILSEKESIEIIENLIDQVTKYEPFNCSKFEKLPSEYKTDLSNNLFKEKTNLINLSFQTYLKLARDCSHSKRDHHNPLEELFLEKAELLLTKTIDTFEISQLPYNLGNYLHNIARFLLRSHPNLKNLAYSLPLKYKK